MLWFYDSIFMIRYCYANSCKTQLYFENFQHENEKRTDESDNQTKHEKLTLAVDEKQIKKLDQNRKSRQAARS